MIVSWHHRFLHFKMSRRLWVLPSVLLLHWKSHKFLPCYTRALGKDWHILKIHWKSYAIQTPLLHAVFCGAWRDMVLEKNERWGKMISLLLCSLTKLLRSPEKLLLLAKRFVMEIIQSEKENHVKSFSNECKLSWLNAVLLWETTNANECNVFQENSGVREHIHFENKRKSTGI